jgi:hypothetical protein
MKKLKIAFLLAVIAFGLVGVADAARTNCCGSEECCASCSGCTK